MGSATLAPFLARPRLNAISCRPRRGAPPAPQPSWPPCRAQVRLVKPPPPAAGHGWARGARRSRRPQPPGGVVEDDRTPTKAGGASPTEAATHPTRRRGWRPRWGLARGT